MSQTSKKLPDFKKNYMILAGNDNNEALVYHADTQDEAMEAVLTAQRHNLSSVIVSARKYGRVYMSVNGNVIENNWPGERIEFINNIPKETMDEWLEQEKKEGRHYIVPTSIVIQPEFNNTKNVNNNNA